MADLEQDIWERLSDDAFKLQRRTLLGHDRLSITFDTISGMDITSGMESFGELLRRQREGRLSQEALAVRAGTSQSYVSRVEAGEVMPTLGQAMRLMNCLGYELRVQAKPLLRRSDRGALVGQLAMSPQERMQSAAALHNAMAEMRAGLSG
ncbi:MAG TPA: helix-turn-helix transcriptional regulator [Solirubrobacteraceae bacterium]|jgi:transcriptional regulator with XRE-family HTH domain|nr:helix-turn-helix transcriptional regulator [Solirubrobacteraceae bacterium]